MLGPYADSFKLSFTITLSYTTDTILPGLGYALGDHSGGSAGKQSTKVDRFSARSLSITNPRSSLDGGHYAGSSKLSFTTTLSYTTDTILPGFGYASGDHSGGCYTPPSVRHESSPPRLTAFGERAFSIVNPRSSLDGGTLCRQLQVVLHQQSVLHHRHNPPWLGISSAYLWSFSGGGSAINGASLSSSY